MRLTIFSTPPFLLVLYVSTFETLDEAIELNNSVEQGLSSSLFTRDMDSAFQFIGPAGSDCGIVNVNSGTSGKLSFLAVLNTCELTVGEAAA